LSHFDLGKTKAFSDEAAVNEALRLVIQLTEIQRGKKSTE